MKMCYLVSFLLILLVLSANSYANEISIFTGIYTKHFDSEYSKEANESNNIIGVCTHSWVISTFINSNDNRSYIIAKQYSTDKYIIRKNTFGKLNLYIGGLYGYGDDFPNIGGWTLAFSPSAEIGYKKISLEALICPFGGGVGSLLLKYTF